MLSNFGMHGMHSVHLISQGFQKLAAPPCNPDATHRCIRCVGDAALKKYRNRKERITIPGRVPAAASQPRSEKATEAASESHPARPLLRTARPLFCSWAFNLVVDDLSHFDEGLFASEERRRCCQPEPVFIVDRHNEAGLAREIETAGNGRSEERRVGKGGRSRGV